MRRHEFEQEFSAASPYCGARVVLSDGTGDTCGLLRDDPVHITAGEKRYRAALHAWAAKYVPEGAKVASVDVYNDPGYRYSSYTYEDPHIDVTVYYELGGERSSVCADIENLGTILTELFAIEESE